MAREADIRIRRSAVAGAIPTPANLNLGELALNTYDGKAYMKKTVGGTETVVEIGGGSGQTAVWKEYTYTATSNQTVFSGSDDDGSTLAYLEDYLQVFLNGILLDNGIDYTATTGTTVVLTNGATTGEIIQISSFAKVLGTGDIARATFAGTGSQVAFDMLVDPGTENNINAFIDGVYQEKSGFSVSGTVVTFDEAPPNATVIEVMIGTRNVSLPELQDLTIGGNLTVEGTTTLNGETTSNANIIMAGWPESDFEFRGDIDGSVRFTAIAGEDIDKGQAIYISGNSGDIPIVSLAIASDRAKMPAFGLSAETITSGTTFQVTTFGSLYGSGEVGNRLDTSGYGFGDNLYVSPITAGELVNVLPPGEAVFLQNIGKVIRVQPNNGGIKVGGAGRTNATPNLDEGNFFLGDSNNQAVIENFNTEVRSSLDFIYNTITSTAATTQVNIQTMSATAFRSAKYTIQVTNSTDSTYHITEILMIHDGTTPSITEYGTIYTGAGVEATFDADISGGLVRLRATPSTTDSMVFKVVCHNIAV